MASSLVFYHYTSTSGANGIRKDGVIKSHNNGVMLSTLKPEDHNRGDILHSIHGNSIPPQFKNRADNIVFVDGSSLDSNKLHQLTPNLYKYSEDIQINSSDVRDKPPYRKSGGNSSAQSTQSHPYTLYYYTSSSNARQIKSAGHIASNRNILLTTLKPEDNYRDEILKTIYGRSYNPAQHAALADWYVKIDGAKLHATKLKKRHNEVYEYSDSIKVDSSAVNDKPSRSAAHDEYLYHYTDSNGATLIKAAGYLKKSGASGAFGVGVYMTDLRPTDFFRDDILKNNYGGIRSVFRGRADWVVKVKKSNLDKKKLKQVGAGVTKDGNRKIFLYEDIICVNSSDVVDKPKCHRAK